MKLRIVQPVYFHHELRQPGEIIEVEPGDFPDGLPPRWAVFDEEKFLPGLGQRRERLPFPGRRKRRDDAVEERSLEEARCLHV